MIDWGDAPTWLATIFAGAAALYAGSAWRRERQRDRAAQAEQVSAWIQPINKPADWIVTINNASELPAFDVTVFVVNTSVPDLKVTLRVAEPKTTTRKDLVDDMGGWRVNVLAAVLDTADAEEPVTARITFRDAGNRWWKRDEHGVLTEMRAAPSR